jgi:predicted ABC-type ATPase
MRVFAGPNGSGKSTVINTIRTQTVNGRPIDFGHYINADDIATAIRKKGFAFYDFEIKTSQKEFHQVAMTSGLVNTNFPKARFEKAFSLRANKLHLINIDDAENIAQIIADFLRKKLIELKKRFSFETVFSHQSKIDIMRRAVSEG